MRWRRTLQDLVISLALFVVISVGIAVMFHYVLEATRPARPAPKVELVPRVGPLELMKPVSPEVLGRLGIERGYWPGTQRLVQELPDGTWVTLDVSLDQDGVPQTLSLHLEPTAPSPSLVQIRTAPTPDNLDLGDLVGYGGLHLGSPEQDVMSLGMEVQQPQGDGVTRYTSRREFDEDGRAVPPDSIRARYAVHFEVGLRGGAVVELTVMSCPLTDMG